MITYDQGEKIIHVARRHHLAFVLETIALFVAGLFPYFAYRIGELSFIDRYLERVGGNIFFLHLGLYSLWLLFLWVLFFIAWSDYYLDVWIITDGRVIDVEHKGIFKRKITAIRIDKIGGMTVSRNWLGNFLNYGNLEIQLLDEEGSLIVEETPDPEKIRDMIAEGQQEALNRLKRVVGESPNTESPIIGEI